MKPFWVPGGCFLSPMCMDGLIGVWFRFGLSCRVTGGLGCKCLKDSLVSECLSDKVGLISCLGCPELMSVGSECLESPLVLGCVLGKVRFFPGVGCFKPGDVKCRCCPMGCVILHRWQSATKTPSL